jgi:uncharacterized protein (DUF58 family)
VSLRLTRSAGLVLALAAAAAVLCRQLRYPELGVAAAVLTGAVVFGGMWAVAANRPAPVSRRLRSDRVTDGNRAVATVTLAGSRRGSGWYLEDTVDGRPVVLSVDGDEFVLPPLPRGRYRLGPLALVTTDPLGLARVRRRAGGDATLWVHPRLHAARPHRAAGGRQPGLHLQAGTPYGIELHRLDDYVVGDDPRFIHWPTSLRRGNLIVRHPARDRLGDVLVVLDTAADSYADGDQFEHAVRTAASIVVALAPEHDSVRLATTGGLSATIDASGRRRTELLDALAAVRHQPGDPSLVAYRPTSPHRVTLVAVTGTGPSGGGDRDAAMVMNLSRRVDGLTLLQVGETAALARPRPRAGPSFEVIAAPHSEALLDAWMARSAP